MIKITSADLEAAARTVAQERYGINPGEVKLLHRRKSKGSEEEFSAEVEALPLELVVESQVPVQLNISLPEGMRDKLTLYARDQGESAASVVRRLIAKQVGEPYDRLSELEERVRRIEDLIA